MPDGLEPVERFPDDGAADTHDSCQFRFLRYRVSRLELLVEENLYQAHLNLVNKAAASQGWQVERVLSCAARPATGLEDSKANKRANKLTGMAGARGHRPCGQLNNCMFPGV